ncbi:MAG: hypothetical protein R2784_08660 [Saprospiraceae bacterium]
MNLAPEKTFTDYLDDVGVNVSGPRYAASGNPIAASFVQNPGSEYHTNDQSGRTYAWKSRQPGLVLFMGMTISVNMTDKYDLILMKNMMLHLRLIYTCGEKRTHQKKKERRDKSTINLINTPMYLTTLEWGIFYKINRYLKHKRKIFMHSKYLYIIFL